MKFFTNQEPGGLHLRSTLVGSVLTGLGIASGIAMLVLIAISVTWGQDPPTNTDIIKEIALASSIYGLGAAIIFTALGLTIHGVTSLVSKKNLTATSGVSRVLAGFSGAVLGSGLWVWQLLLASPENGLARLAGFVLMTALTGTIITGAWLAVSSLLNLRSTDEGKALSWKLAVTAGVTSLFPWAYFLINLLVRP